MRCTKHTKISARFFFLLAGIVFLCPPGLLAQYYLPLDRDHTNAYERALNSRFVNQHTAIKPYRDQQLEPLRDSITGYKIPGIRPTADSRKKNDSVASKPSKSDIGINGILDLRGGFDAAGKSPLMEFAGGLRIDGNYTNKLAWDLRFAAGTSALSGYQDSMAKYMRVAPGWGDRAYMSDTGRYAWQHASGYVSWVPNKVFSFQAGRDKHFWGDGYRSLFLSDAGGAYPFLKINASIWKLQYTSLYAMHTDMTDPLGVKNNFRSKFGTFHYISWNATKRLNIGVFEAVVWQGEDENRYRGFDPNYLNPLIFFRPVEYSLGSSDNAMLGFAFKLKAAKSLQFYGQLILDEFYLKEIKARNGWWANKQGGQVGFKGFNLFKVKNLDIQGEVNVVRPYTYAHGSVQQNYGHANVSLAHPQGANFAEAVGFLRYRKNRLLVEGKLLACRYGLDTAGLDYGHNIFVSYLQRPNEYGNTLFQGLQTDLVQAELRAAWLLYPPVNLKIEAALVMRTEENVQWSDKNAWFWLGIRTGLFNDYRDF
ncbi:MAG: hypothetical protein FD123_1152 [Bacteroidetes bacterium]|nr:MAG: hypothetical protein FD123_1152 [Bacteroidota bacterium]